MLNNNFDVNFRDLIANCNKVINYISKNSDSFSFISNLKKPYSEYPPNYEHDHVMKPFVPFLERYIIGIKKWPGTITKDNHKVLIVYNSCKDSRKVLQKIPNPFLPIENGLPEDICFYRNQEPWFATISHEEKAFLINATEDDIAFFRENCIRVYE